MWIIFSDIILNAILYNPAAELTKYQTLKGWAFILITALILYALISSRVKELNGIIENKEKVEGELRLAESKFKLAFHKSPVAMTISTLEEGIYIEVNNEFVKAFGYNEEDVVGKSVNELNVWVDFKNRAEFTRELSQKGVINDKINYFRIKSGEVRTFMTSAELLNFTGRDVILAVHRDITLEKEIENQIRESELKYRTLVENIQDGLWLVQGSKIIFVNDSLANILGYSKEELEGKKLEEIIAPEDVETVMDRYKKRIEGKDVPANYQFRLLKKNGETVLVNLKVGIIGFRDNIATIGTIKNISENRLMQKELEYSQIRFNEFSNLMPYAILEVDRYGNITFMNNSAFDMYGYNKEDFEDGLNIFKMVSELELQKAQKEFKILFANKNHVVTSDYMVKRKDGSIFPVLVFASNIVRNDEIIGLRALVIDITERKKSEETLYKFSLALEQSPVSIIITDTKGNIEYVNPKFLSVSGYSKEEVIGQKPSILKSGSQSNEYYENLWQTITKGKDWRGELHNKRKDGTLYWELVSISPIRNWKGEIVNFLAVKEDITINKIYEEELIKAKEKAEEADRLKTNFLTQVSHEVRTPLNIILGYTSYLREVLENQLDEENKALFDSVYTAGRRLFRTIDLILNMSVLKTGKITPRIKELHINNICNEILKEFKYIAETKNLKLLFIASDEDIIVKSDEYILKQMLQNLVDNAIKYTEKGDINLKTFRVNGKIIIEVVDKGIGISTDYLQKIFSPFSQEDNGYSRKYEGTGLGLALVKNYADILNIKITVDSKKGEGSTFRLEL